MDQIIVGMFIFFIIGNIVGFFVNRVTYCIPRGINLISTSIYMNSSERYKDQKPMVNLVLGVVFSAIFVKLGIVWYLPFVLLSFSALLALILIDFEYMAVPDNVNIAALIFALIQPNAIEAVISAGIAAGSLFLIAYLASLYTKKEVMGGADVIVAGTMGALLGFPNVFYAIFLSALLGLIPAIIEREKGVPFVPFLVMSTFIVYIYSEEINPWLKSIFL